MPTLVEFQRSVVNIIPSGPGDAGKVRQIRELMREALADADFVLSCIDRAVTNFELEPDRRPPPPLFISPSRNFAAHIVYWPPNHGNTPHLHATWGVTGVFHNEVAVETFVDDGPDDTPVLSLLSRIDAQRGETGYLLPSCIHRVRNDTDRAAATLHLFGVDDENRPAECTTMWFGDRSEEAMVAGLQGRAMGVFSEILLGMNTSESTAILKRVFALSPNTLKLRLVQVIAKRDLALSHLLSLELEGALTGNDRIRLAAINRKIAVELQC